MLAPLEVFAGRVASTLRVARESFSVCLVSDAEMARMNQRFRGKRGPTDVLSFPANGVAGVLARRNGSRGSGAPRARWRRRGPSLNGGGDGREFLGDIAIAPQTARRNAQRDGRALSSELQILILHGLLHLLGYDHETDEGEMERLELRLRQRLGISRERGRPRRRPGCDGCAR
ncbi:MAG: rRNA maturation RNase YbeY, partial [Candidatus Acidiferrales bacterium]